MRALALAAVAALLLTGPAAAAAKAASGSPKAPSKMGECAKKWDGMSAGDKQKYADKGKTMKSKKGNALTGYNAWTSECMKAKA